MLLYNFNDFDDFKCFFGFRLTPEGHRVRKNKILLSFLKSKSIIKWARDTNNLKILRILNMSGLKDACLAAIKSEIYAHLDRGGVRTLHLKGRVWVSDLYYTDDRQGCTSDGDKNSIRYVRRDNDRVYKMRAGKMYRHLILFTKFGKALPEAVLIWLCEELTTEWCGYNTADLYKLHVDDDFEAIYSNRRCATGFGSCMADKDQHYFYSDSVKAKAAYITDDDNEIVARAVIFTEVEDVDTGKEYRLLERQYSKSGDDQLKLALVNALIKAGEIDGYKRVGADCHNSRAFIGVDGDSLAEKKFRIECNLDYEDTLSYQDSFKWYDMDDNYAYNYKSASYTHELDKTDRVLEGGNYDEYHECWTSDDLVDVHYHGQLMTCSECDLDDFTCIDGRYYHNDDVAYCHECGEYYLAGEGEYSEATGSQYCCEDCKEEAEIRFCKENYEEWVMFDGEAVRIERLVECPVCGDKFIKDYGYYSDITDTKYCTSSCKCKAEKDLAVKGETPYIYCSECHSITLKENAIEVMDGVWICKECNEISKMIAC